MDEMQTNAEINLMRFMLLEIAAALQARGVLQGADVAGILLRTEWAAEMLDDIGETEGDITRPHAGLARITTDQWSERLGLTPALYTLRLAHMDWLTSGQKKDPPLAAKHIVEHFSE